MRDILKSLRENLSVAENSGESIKREQSKREREFAMHWVRAEKKLLQLAGDRCQQCGNSAGTVEFLFIFIHN